MKRALAGAALLLTSGLFVESRAQMEFQADIVIGGGSFSAPAVALQAARDNPDAQILLIEITDWLGGQATSQGVAAIDNAWHSPGAGLMRDNPPLYYPADYLNWINRIKAAPGPGYGYGGDGVNWVSREGYDPRTGAAILDQMVAELPNITVLKMTAVKNVQTTTEGADRIITGLTLVERIAKPGYTPFTDFLSDELPDWYSTAESTRFTKAIHTVVPRDAGRGMVVVDATELGDIMVLSGASYTVGRERTTEKFDESGNPPAMDESGSQAFVFPFCMSTNSVTNAEAELRTSWADFDAYYNQQVASFFSLGNFSWARVWTYRRLHTTGAGFQFDGVFAGDITMQNWNPGNDYPYGTIFKTKAQVAPELADWMGGVLTDEIRECEKHAVAFYFYMKGRRTSTFDTRLARGAMQENMMGTAHGLSKMPYLRCTRRLVGLENFRIMGREFVDTRGVGYTPGPSFRYYDSVGIGSYASDVHPTRISTGISPHVEQPAPFYVPYRSLASANVRNLLATGKNIAASYVTNSAYRLHPIEWTTGSAAGAAAAIMAEQQLGNDAFLEVSRLRELQARVHANSPIRWAAYDAQPIPPQNGDLIINDLRPLTANSPFAVEAYYTGAVRAEVWRASGTVKMGETTTRANGRLLYNAAGLVAGRHLIEVRLFDAGNTQVDTLTATIDVTGSVASAIIVDNSDAAWASTGSWTLGTAQPDRYGLDYRYASGTGNVNSSTATATWQLPLTQPGEYDIAVWYPASSNRATDAPFIIHHDSGPTTVRINQTSGGGAWLTLGRFRFTDLGSARVVLTNAVAVSGRFVMADAVRALPVADDAEPASGWVVN